MLHPKNKTSCSPIFDRHQYLIFNDKGALIDSNDGIFNTSFLTNNTIIDYFPFIESIWDTLGCLLLNDPDLKFDRVVSVFEGLEGIYDYIFRKINFNGENVFYWQILDNTTKYNKERERQQYIQSQIIKGK